MTAIRHEFTQFRHRYLGIATSAFQIEGGATADGKGPSIWDTFSHTPGKIIDGTNGDVACDHYNRYPEDVAIMASLGVDAYRFSMAWARVQPTGKGAWNEAGFAFYDKLLTELEAWHRRPRHAVPLGPAAGPARRRRLAHRDTATILPSTRPKSPPLRQTRETIATHNEPWCTANLGYGNAQFAPGVAASSSRLQVSHHLLLSHGLAMRAMRDVASSAQLGIVLNQWRRTPPPTARPTSPWPNSNIRARGMVHGPDLKGHYPALALKVHGETPRRAGWRPAIIQGKLDFMGLNY